MPSFAEIWTYAGPLVGAVLGFVSSYILEKRKERILKRTILREVECIELVNTQILGEDKLGPLRGRVQIKVPRAGKDTELIEVKELYFARFRIRNLSDTPIGKFLVSSENAPNSVWFVISEGENQRSPDWSKEFAELIEEAKISEEAGWYGSSYPIPYLNPYRSTGHEVFIDLASYMPLYQTRIAGGAQGIKFLFRKANAR